MKQDFCSVFSRFFGLLCLHLIISCPAAAAGIFTIVPETQYVYLNHNVIFECATNLTGYSLTFFYSGSVAPTVKQTNLPDGGIKVSTTFTVTNALNGTNVRCIADDDTNPIISTSKVYAYAQGPPGAVSDLQGYQLDHCYIVPSWSPPFLGQLSEQVTSLDIMSTSTPSITASPNYKGFKIGSVVEIVIFVIIVVSTVCLVKKRHSYRNIPTQKNPKSTVSITEDLVFQDENGKTIFNNFNRQHINDMVIQESIFNIPIPVQDDRHEENPYVVPIRVQDDYPQSSSSSLPLYGDVLSRLKTPPPPSVQSNVTNSGTNFQSSTCSIERESEETSNDISKPLHCWDTSFKLELAFVCNSPPSDKDETPSSVSLDVSVKEVNNRPKVPPNVQADVTYSELIIQSD